MIHNDFFTVELQNKNEVAELGGVFYESFIEPVLAKGLNIPLCLYGPARSGKGNFAFGAFAQAGGSGEEYTLEFHVPGATGSAAADKLVRYELMRVNFAQAQGYSNFYISPTIPRNPKPGRTSSAELIDLSHAHGFSFPESGSRAVAAFLMHAPIPHLKGSPVISFCRPKKEGNNRFYYNNLMRNLDKGRNKMAKEGRLDQETDATISTVIQLFRATRSDANRDANTNIHHVRMYCPPDREELSSAFAGATEKIAAHFPLLSARL